MNRPKIPAATPIGIGEQRNPKKCGNCKTPYSESDFYSNGLRKGLLIWLQCPNCNNTMAVKLPPWLKKEDQRKL